MAKIEQMMWCAKCEHIEQTTERAECSDCGTKMENVGHIEYAVNDCE